ncbi:MAG: asparaginase domain-containing protein, partial [Pseudomonadota bacterium]
MPQEISKGPLRLIYAGGTIGSAGRPLAPLPTAEFRARWDEAVAPRLAARAETDVPLAWSWIDPPLDSSDMGPGEWAVLARAVLSAAEEGARGIVVLHGTDTMASSAAALAMLLTLLDEDGTPCGRLGCPLVLTGAQRPLFDDRAVAAGTDAFDNLVDAIAAAGSTEHGAAGPLLAFAGHRLPAARVAKQHTADDAAFGCPKGIAWPETSPAAQPAALHRGLDAISATLGRRPVPVFHPMPEAPDLQADLLEAVTAGTVEAPPAALLIAGFGEGNLPVRAADRMTLAIQRLRAAGAPVMVASQVWGGPAGRAAYAAGSWLAAAGAIPAGHMALPAAHAKLHIGAALAVAHGWPLGRLEAWLGADIAGETLPP